MDNMEGGAAASQEAVRQSQSLCAGEQKYVRERKQKVLKTLQKLGINCAEESVPHIALLGTGGGQRACVALMGSLYQMEQEGLLDTLLYLAGVSGSTWCMSILYSDPQWSTNMDKAVSRLVGPGVSLKQICDWLEERSKEENFSLTDFWGAFTSAHIMKRLEPRHLSEEASRPATNPYPVYCAIEKYHFSEGPIEGRWFEVSPHEAGFPEVGLFVETSMLGSKFQGGQRTEQKPEMDMVKLRGIFGSALGDLKTIINNILPFLRATNEVQAFEVKAAEVQAFEVKAAEVQAFEVEAAEDEAAEDEAAEEYHRVHSTLVQLAALIRSTTDSPTALSDLDRLEKILRCRSDDDGEKAKMSTFALQRSGKVGERTNFHQQRIQLQRDVEGWSQTVENADVSDLLWKILPLIWHWEWGTTANFLYQYKGDGNMTPYLHSEERVHLIDAGLMINTGYPSFLGDKRDIDLIIAPEYSAGDAFETLTLARDYAAEVEKPFPKIDEKVLEDKHWPKDCYVFEGKGKEPTIVHMPLFNRKNCKDEAEVEAKMKEFCTFHLPYSEEQIKKLLEIAKANIRNNKEILRSEIEKATHRRQKKRTGAVTSAI